MSNKGEKLSCSDCGIVNCYRQEKSFPDFCLTTAISSEDLKRVKDIYMKDELASKFSMAAAEIEGRFYGKYTRVEETIAFARRIEAHKIGIATCVGLISEARMYAKILKAKGLESYCVICKVGSIDKAEVGIPKDLKIEPDCYEALCNPVMQADILNKAETDLNVIIGLCVGHDSLFIKYSKAPVTTLVTKDRVLGHNPGAALYLTNFYYKRLLKKED